MGDICPQCGSSDPLVRNELTINGDTDHQTCRNSWHPPQAFSTAGLNSMISTCGPHCGVKDEMEGHCSCKDCHNGPLPLGLQRLKSIKGKSVTGVKPD